MKRTTLIMDHNRLYKALDALLELPGDKYRQAVNDLQAEISEIDQKLAELAEKSMI